ncbi:MBL fold metallo-hydrolase [Acidisoma sp.]|uniref:MBL fold metallo-hydrolase n=1 Tax=Acidisoma sp. TaxID=1872115 RepID=UPI003AFFCADE
MPQPPRYPLSDHYDGEIFFNPRATAPQPVEAPPPANRRRGGIVAILRWRFGGERRPWPAQPPDPKPTGDPQALPPLGAAAVTFIGHSTFLIRVGGLTILTDPVFSERCSPVSWAGPKRARPPGRDFAGLPRIDLLLISHNHYDHMDLPSLRAIRRRDNPQVVTPLGNAVHLAKAGLDRVHELDWWQSTELSEGIRVTATPARHFSSRTLRDRNHSLWSGFMLDIAGHRLFFAGDSGAGGHWTEIGQRLGAPDLALLPIGAYEPRSIMAPVHMNPAEAVAAHRALGAAHSVGMHFGTFQLTDEPIDEPPAAMAAARAEAGLAEEAFVTLGFGETRPFPL